jgi:hypothetical protein
VLTAYVDESGQHQDESKMFVAGYFGNDEQWKRVAQAWPIAIAPRPHLHMRKIRFQHETERKLLERAGVIPRECGLEPLFGGVRQADYLDLIAGTDEERLLAGYIVCCYAMLIRTLPLLPPDERIEVVFERQDQYSHLADVALSALAKAADYEPRLRTPDGQSKLANWRFVGKDETPLTEPADYFAYALYQVWLDRKSLRAKWCKPILGDESNEGYGAILDRGEIRQIILAGGLVKTLIDYGVKQLRKQLR